MILVERGLLPPPTNDHGFRIINAYTFPAPRAINNAIIFKCTDSQGSVDIYTAGEKKQSHSAPAIDSEIYYFDLANIPELRLQNVNRIFFGCAPFSNDRGWRSLIWQEANFVFVSAFGFKNKQWLDGPLLQVDSQANLINFVPMGSAVRLTLSDASYALGNPPSKDELIHNYTDILESLISAVGHLYTQQTSSTVIVRIENFSLRNAVALTIFRKRRLANEIFVDSEQPYKSWPAEWKRLCQNLGIEMYEKTRPANGDFVELRNLSDLIDEKWLKGLFSVLNETSQVIPPGLAKEKSPRANA